jgi:hypothetical protein
MSELNDAAGAKGQIELILEEYRALRSEVDQRTSARTTLVGFLAAGTAFVVGSRSNVLSWITVTLFAVLVIVV